MVLLSAYGFCFILLKSGKNLLKMETQQEYILHNCFSREEFSEIHENLLMYNLMKLRRYLFLQIHKRLWLFFTNVFTRCFFKKNRDAVQYF